jgi:hypothetical protein
MRLPFCRSSSEKYWKKLTASYVGWTPDGLARLVIAFTEAGGALITDRLRIRLFNGNMVVGDCNCKGVIFFG